MKHIKLFEDWNEAETSDYPAPKYLVKPYDKEDEEKIKKINDEIEEEEDLFDRMDELPNEVKDVLDKYSKDDNTYENLDDLLAELEPLGYTFEYGLDAVPYGLRKIDEAR